MGGPQNLKVEKYCVRPPIWGYGRPLYGLKGIIAHSTRCGDVNENVDFFVALASLYNDGQYNLMAEHAVIFNTKGARANIPIGGELPDGGLNKSLDAGTAQLTALSLQIDGIGDEISDLS